MQAKQPIWTWKQQKNACRAAGSSAWPGPTSHSGEDSKSQSAALQMCTPASHLSHLLSRATSRQPAVRSCHFCGSGVTRACTSILALMLVSPLMIQYSSKTLALRNKEPVPALPKPMNPSSPQIEIWQDATSASFMAWSIHTVMTDSCEASWKCKQSGCVKCHHQCCCGMWLSLESLYPVEQAS